MSDDPQRPAEDPVSSLDAEGPADEGAVDAGPADEGTPDAGRRERPDPRLRPADPAGTQPKVDPSSLLPAPRTPAPGAAQAPADGLAGAGVYAAATAPADEIVDAELVDADSPSGLLPDLRPRGETIAASSTETPHAPRFQFLLGALIALALAAIAGTVAVVIGGSPGGDQIQWSPWHPSGSNARAAQQIADHVGQEYRLPSGNQLVAVSGGPLQVANLPMQVALRADPNNGGNISILSGKGVLYRLCGLGTKCAIDEGKASTQRHLLLQREALELALYSFRYLDSLNQVVVFMPPAPGKDPTEALFFRPGDVAPELNRPLGDTLSLQTPSVSGVTSSPDAPLVQRITDSTAYNFSLTQANSDTSVYLVLRPLGTTG